MPLSKVLDLQVLLWITLHAAGTLVVVGSPQWTCQFNLLKKNKKNILLDKDEGKKVANI